jgi:hypothetical protein
MVIELVYKKNKMSTDRENGRGNKRARVARGSRNPKLMYSKILRRKMKEILTRKAVEAIKQKEEKNRSPRKFLEEKEDEATKQKNEKRKKQYWSVLLGRSPKSTVRWRACGSSQC